MDILEKLVLPANAEHIQLLKYILALAYIIFYPFLGMIIGGTLLSVFFNFWGRRTHNKHYIRFAKDVIDKLAISKNAGIGLGLIPVVAITFIYAQFLYGANTIAISVMIFSVLLYLGAFIYIYIYKSTFQVESVVDSLKNIIHTDIGKDKQIPEDVYHYEANILAKNFKSGIIGLILILTATFFFVGSVDLAMNKFRWTEVTNIFNMVLSWKVIVDYIYVLVSSMVITGGAILFFFFIWQGGIKSKDEEYLKFARNYASKLALGFMIVQPVFLFISFILLPEISLSSSVFIYMGIVLILTLLVLNFLYAILKNSEIKFAGITFILMILVFTFNVLKDQIALSNALREQTLFVSIKGDEYEKKKLSTMPVKDVGISGEEIYNQKCAACHKFDQKVVGPPYNDVVGKYNGDVKKLAAFIYNPVKVSADYPPMPNQGLKQKEAEAVAKYLIEKVSGGK